MPLWAASAEYFHVKRASWAPALRALRELGFRFIDVRVPWNLHELEPGTYDFRGDDGCLDVAGFLDEVAAADLYAVVRLGPRQEASSDLAWAGLPRRVAWNAECHALSPKGHPVVFPRWLPACPEPSLFSARYSTEAIGWLSAVAQQLVGSVYPKGPITLVQLGCSQEGMLLERTLGDYHPAALDGFSRSLKECRSQSPLSGDSGGAFSSDERVPELPFGQSEQSLETHLAWLSFQRAQQLRGLLRMKLAVEEAGMDRIPIVFPEATCRQATAATARLGLTRSAESRVFVEMHESRSEALETPAYSTLFAGTGVESFPESENELLFQGMQSLAGGRRGFCVQPGLTRARHVGFLVGEAAEAGDLAASWRAVLAALDRCQFHQLRRTLAVGVVVPRQLLDVAILSDPLRPLDPTQLRLGGRLGLAIAAAKGAKGGGQHVATVSFLEALVGCLRQLGLPFALLGESELEYWRRRVPWLVVVGGEQLDQRGVARLRAFGEGDPAVSFGPGSLPFELLSASSGTNRLSSSRPELASQIASQAAELRLPQLSVEPTEVELSMFTAPPAFLGTTQQVLFAVNSSGQRQQVRTAISGFSAVDAISQEPLNATAGPLEFPVSERSVRMLELRSPTKTQP